MNSHPAFKSISKDSNHYHVTYRNTIDKTGLAATRFIGDSIRILASRAEDIADAPERTIHYPTDGKTVPNILAVWPAIGRSWKHEITLDAHQKPAVAALVGAALAHQKASGRISPLPRIQLEQVAPAELLLTLKTPEPIICTLHCTNETAIGTPIMFNPQFLLDGWELGNGLRIRYDGSSFPALLDRSSPQPNTGPLYLLMPVTNPTSAYSKKV